MMNASCDSNKRTVRQFVTLYKRLRFHEPPVPHLEQLSTRLAIFAESDILQQIL